MEPMNGRFFISPLDHSGHIQNVEINARTNEEDRDLIPDPNCHVDEAPRRVEIVISEEDYNVLKEHLWSSAPLEQQAFLLAGVCSGDLGLRLLVRDLIFPKPSDFLSQTPCYIELDPSYYLPVLDRCRDEGLHIIDVHSHPFAAGGVRFSELDVRNELEKFTWYSERLPAIHAATLVFGRESFDGHWWDSKARKICPISAIRVVGSTLKIIPASSAAEEGPVFEPCEDIFHRQELAFGRAGQEIISKTRVAIIGCGGLGSVLAQQLAYLGVRKFVLVDDDRVESTNLNRLVGAFPGDARLRRRKVSVLKRNIRAVCPDAQVIAVPYSIVDPRAQQIVRESDLLISGVDSDGARLVVNELSVRYLIPYIDLGTGINLNEGRVAEAGGQLWLVRPGGFCLQCIGALDPYKARVDLMDEVERGRHIERGYGTGVPQPSVIFLNATLASLAVGEIVKLLTGFRKPETVIFYDALKPSVEVFLPPSRDPNCPVCRREALYALGDEPEGKAFHRKVPAAGSIT
jgi:molybdopterin/thiamine biosynthesis adenylyltransferase